MTPILATGILVACGTMFPCMLLVATLINPALMEHLLWPAAIMALVTYAAAACYYWYAEPRCGGGAAALLDNPLGLRSALSFGALLALVMLVAQGLKSWFGDSGMLLLAAVSGITDVDAINLTLSRMSLNELTAALALQAIVMAAAVNSLVKGVIASAVGGPALGLRVAVPLLGAGLAGMLVTVLLPERPFFRRGVGG